MSWTLISAEHNEVTEEQQEGQEKHASPCRRSRLQDAARQRLKPSYFSADLLWGSKSV